MRKKFILCERSFWHGGKGSETTTFLEVILGHKHNDRYLVRPEAVNSTTSGTSKSFCCFQIFFFILEFIDCICCVDNGSNIRGSKPHLLRDRTIVLRSWKMCTGKDEKVFREYRSLLREQMRNVRGIQLRRPTALWSLFHLLMPADHSHDPCNQSLQLYLLFLRSSYRATRERRNYWEQQFPLLFTAVQHVRMSVWLTW